MSIEERLKKLRLALLTKNKFLEEPSLYIKMKLFKENSSPEGFKAILFNFRTNTKEFNNAKEILPKFH